MRWALTACFGIIGLASDASRDVSIISKLGLGGTHMLLGFSSAHRIPRTNTLEDLHFDKRLGAIPGPVW